MKKQMKRMLALLLIAIGLKTNVLAQVSSLGNGFPGAATDYCGWNATRLFPLTVAHKGNFPINFQTNGTQRMTIMNTTGFVGIGVTAPTELLHINDGANSYLHVTNGTGSTATDGLKVGMLVNTPHAIVANQQLNPTIGRLQFAVGGATNAQTRMTIDAQGEVGIGLAHISPNDLLDVSGGDIDVATSTSSYKLGDLPVLWHKGSTENIFVGVGAGSAAGNLASENTYVGRDAGFNGTGTLLASQPNIKNTFVGKEAGFNNQGAEHTFIGYQSGFSFNAATVRGNTFVGSQAGFSMVLGGESVFVGWHAGLQTTLSSNTFIGYNCGSANQTGGSNTFVGLGAGNGNVSNNSNTLIGSNANKAGGTGIDGVSVLGAGAFGGAMNSTAIGVTATANGQDATAVGANTSAPDANTMILGVNTIKVGIGLSGGTGVQSPQNKLEINADPNSFNYTGTGGSGLRFRQLINTSSSQSNNGTNTVLSVDVNGDIILVTDQTSTSIGGSFGACPTPIALMGNDAAMDLNGLNCRFIGQGPGNSVSIGPSCGTVISAKLDVVESLGSTGFRTTAINGTNSDIYTGSIFGLPFIAVQGATDGLQTGPFARNIGGNFTGTNSRNNIGVAGTAIQNSGSSTLVGVNAFGGVFTANAAGLRNTGTLGTVTGDVTGTTSNIAVQAIVTGNTISTFPSLANIAVCAYADPNHPVSYAGFFDGNVWINGPLNGAAGYALTSDVSFKTGIDTISNPLFVISQLKPKTFYFDTNNVYRMNFSSRKQYGLVAQDVELILPELVSSTQKPAEVDSAGNIVTNSVTFKNLNYNAFIGILIAGMQKQQKQIAKQDSLIHELLVTMNSCCSMGSRTSENGVTKIDVELSNTDAIVLNQNVPNPFAEQTTISYNIPQNVSFAQILFYDINGRQIKAVDIHKKGKGQLNVFANDLSNGVYSYTLIVDGKIFETKKMIKQQ